MIARRRLRRARSRRPASAAERDEVKVEWREGDLADLAFLAGRVDRRRVQRLRGRRGRRRRRALFRQVQRVLQARTRRSCSRTSTRWRSASTPAGVVARARTSTRARSTWTRRRSRPARVYTRDVGEVFTELGRAGFRVDTILEPRRRRRVPREAARDARHSSCWPRPARKASSSTPPRSGVGSPLARCRARGPRRRGARRPRPRPSGPRRDGPRAGSRAPRPRPGPASTPR